LIEAIAMRRAHLFPILVFLAVVGGSLPAWAAEFGSFSLQPGETRDIRIGSTYRTIRLCNDSESAGVLQAVIGDHDPIQLAPGLCAEDSGDTIQVRNAANGTVSGIYRRQYDFFDGN
jgi:hypothetical protein